MKDDLHNGHLRMCSDQAVELSALLAQAEFGDYNQNTARYWYSELCGEEPSADTVDRYGRRADPSALDQPLRTAARPGFRPAVTKVAPPSAASYPDTRRWRA